MSKEIINATIREITRALKEDLKDSEKQLTVNVNPTIADKIRELLKTPKNKALIFHGAKIRKKKTLLINQVEII